MERAALDEAVRDIARQIIAEGVDAKAAFDSIGASAAELSQKIVALRAQAEVATTWRPMDDFDAAPYATIDILVAEGWVRGWWAPPMKGTHAKVDRTFWMWPTPDAEPSGGYRAVMIKPKAWRPVALREEPQNWKVAHGDKRVPVNPHYREQK